MDEYFLPNLESLRQAEAKILAVNPDGALAVAVRATAKMVNSSPMAYLRYGCYWFSVKEILNANLENGYGDITDTFLTEIYRGESDLQTLFAAQEFMEFYSANFVQGSNVFNLSHDENGQPIEWQLFDEDMEP